MLSLKNLRPQILLMIALLSGVGIVGSLFVIHIYHDQSMQDIKSSTEDLVKYESITFAEKHTKLLSELGLNIQSDPSFKLAIKNRNISAIKRYLNEEFSEYYVTTQQLVVNKIYAYDKNYNLLADSDLGDNYNSHDQFCSQLINAAKPRKGADRVRVLQSFCYHHEHAFNSVIVPVGTLVPIGYLQIISRPYNIFQQAENKLAMPLSIVTGTGQTSYKSETWENKENHLNASYTFFDIKHKPAVTITMQKDISELNASFHQSRTLIILTLSLVTLLVMIFIYLRLEKKLLSPLSHLENQLSILENDEKQLGKSVAVSGFPEINSLTSKFNDLSYKLSESYKLLETMAYRDQLTSLPNRSRLQEILEFHCNINRQNDTPFSLIVMDLNRFKAVNDAMGHQAGDVLLQEVSLRLEKVLRKSDFLEHRSESDRFVLNEELVSRLGGDEFAAVLPAVGDEKNIKVIIEKILDCFKDIFAVDQHKFNISTSIGVVVCPDHGSDPKTLLQHADLAMYYAKENQQNYAFYDAKLDTQHLDTLRMDTALREAIKNDDFYLVYQPKINLKTNEMSSVEVLLRWQHEEKGFIPPDQFILVAEQTGLINDVTKWVFSAALKQKSEWEKNNFHCQMSINLSAKNLWDQSLVNFIKQELFKYNVLPQSICLELTETAVMSDPAFSIIVLTQLRSLGLKISIDDFGTGYSSLSYLKKLPVDEIKIDRSFIMDMDILENQVSATKIVNSIISLGQNMGLKVVAEGVETQSTYYILQNASCDLAQGFYMGKPMVSEDLIEWIVSSQWAPGKTHLG